MFDANLVISINDFDGKTVREKVQRAYEAIGDYIKDHADELAAGTTENTSGSELNIKIHANEVITLENKIMYYPTRKVEN